MGIHWTELLIISVVALLIFGPKRLPEMGSAIGKTYKEFKKSLSEAAESAAPESATSAQVTSAPAAAPGAPDVAGAPRTQP
jgi:sec-independent protein translocase protein TatA